MKLPSESLVLKMTQEEAYIKGISRTISTGEWEILNMVEIHSTIVDSVVHRTGLDRQRIKAILRSHSEEVLCRP